jgi:hypothetical protein
MKLQEEINLNVTLKSPMEIDSALNSLYNIIKQATRDATPTPKIISKIKQEMFQLKLKDS